MPASSTNLVLGPAFLAHQGGWDEFLLIAIPVVFIGGLLALANRRVNQRLADTDHAEPTGQATAGPATSGTTAPDSPTES